MATEIERKFLVNEKWSPQGEMVKITQGYLNLSPDRTVRVRIQDDLAFITVKGKPADGGFARVEYEYPIPKADAIEMLKLADGAVIKKKRYKLYHVVKLWEVDVFYGDNAGLIVAECELFHEAESLILPPWVGQEVTFDPRYLNASLVTYPYKTWSS